MRIKLSEYARRTYSDTSRPHIETLRKWAANGDIPGAYQNTAGHWWVEIGEAEQANIQRGIDKLIGNDPEIKELLAS